MAARNSSTLVAAGFGLVLGVCGGITGAWIVGTPQSAPLPSAAPTSAATAFQDPALREAIAELTRAVRALHESLAARPAEPTRSPALSSSTPDVERLVAALEGFARLANAAPATSGLGGRHGPPLIVPTRARDEGLLLELAQTDSDVRSRRYRFLTYQQVLDRFGSPDEVHQDGSWYYDLSETGGLVFRFYDGMLVNIY